MSEGASFAKGYIEDVLTFFGLNTSVDVDENEEGVELNIPSTHLNGFIIGQKGEGLRSLQYLLNMAMRAAGHEESVMVDVAGYRKQADQRLERQAQRLADKVAESGYSKRMHPMSAYERRVVHQALSDRADVSSDSEGEGRDRRIVIKPLGAEESKEE